ncbi:MarR family winged helix-turn-helix transcriptional regulator [Streptomyces sp. AK04-3B]|uniref:MarR family winged helix-turn-helix transcriptional regulator n=1 Tax=unclassified Streptomyces TaxID=2593676 RepID=UPI0029ADD640|nr:MarR family winged helix-turn-helix transcriptional regulator [Streptomyces sp. AK04-3B]MDX3803274.1 MarR family winged helix-turn-helix transcriptional regulator [Streptomyces sp. AK04-3B]
MTVNDRSRDLAAMLQPLLDSLIEAELPVLAEHGLSMWGYAVLGALADGPVRTQAALSEAIGADKTRIITTLDKLQAAGLITRLPDPADRRVRLLSITGNGREVQRSVRAAIRVGEDRILAALPPSDRRSFLKSLDALTETVNAQRRG